MAVSQKGLRPMPASSGPTAVLGADPAGLTAAYLLSPRGADAVVCVADDVDDVWDLPVSEPGA